MITLITAFIVDSLIGDPQTRFHPIALLGRCIAVLDKLFYNRKYSQECRLSAAEWYAYLFYPLPMP